MGENRLAAAGRAASVAAMNRREFLLTSGAALSFGFVARGALFGQSPAAPPAAAPKTPVQMPPPVTEFKTIRRNTGYFTGRGGTIGWLVNGEAFAVVDTQFPETAAICLAGLPGRAQRTLDAVINSHHHWDHTAGNKVFRPVAKRIVAHQKVPALQAAAAARNPQMGEFTVPDTLFADTWRADIGDEVVNARHLGAAHTGGDIIVHFERANVVHLGDLVFNRLYPVTDRPGGCSVRNWVKVLETALQTYPKDAIYIYGHGKPAFGVTGAAADLGLMRDFLSALVAHVEREIKAGTPRAELVKLAVLPRWPDYEPADPKTSRLPGNLGAVYDELTGPRA